MKTHVCRIGWFGRKEQGLTPILSAFPADMKPHEVIRRFEYEGTEFIFQIDNDVPEHMAVAYAFQYMLWFVRWEAIQRL